MRTFITSDLSGSTTEPVKRKISVHVVSARIASAHGRWAPSDACWSTKPAVCPVTRAAGSSARTVRTSCCVRSDEPLLAREEVEPPEAGCDLPGRQDGGDARRRREARGRRLRRRAVA